MNTKGNLALAVLAGISIGAVSVMAVHAQEAKTPPAYLIAETEVTDRTAFQKYAEKVPETLAPYSGSFHYVVRGGKTQALDGQPPKGIVVIAFDSTETLAWYKSLDDSALVASYVEGLATSNVPKLFIKAEPGALLGGGVNLETLARGQRKPR
jgi:uncharacterized protein (DUF1330 family)